MKKNNKAIQVFLGVALLGIWGTIIYQIFAAMGDDEPITVNANYFSVDTTQKKTIETFRLSLNYPDPFLGKTVRSSMVSSMSENDDNSASSIAAPPPVVQKAPKKVVFPAISYHGMVKNNATGKKIALLKIANQSKRMESGEVFNHLHLIQVEKDSVRIYFKNETRTFKKKR